MARNSTGTFEVLVPVPISSNKGNTTLNVGVTGPGFGNSGGFFAYIYSNNGGNRTPFALIGKGLLGNIGLGPLQSYCKDQGREFFGSEVDLTNASSDWRAYSGAAVILLGDSEWLGLSSAQRGALCDYVSQGGHLTVFTTSTQASPTGLQLPDFQGKPGAYGFGTISLETTQAFPPDAYSLAEAVQRNPANLGQNVDEGFSTWGLRPLVGTIVVSAVFILSFVVLFGGLVGPVNLFVFATGKNRFRLFWTTPLISLLASIALVAGILLTDGLGGRGEQLIAIYSLPASDRETVIQEQVSRTALLFSNQWRSDQNYLITPISDQAMKNAMARDGSRTYAGNRDLSDSPDTYHQTGNEFSGNWFRSRSVSGQYLQAVRPSRAAITVMNSDAVNAGHAPVVLSSFPTELDRVFLLDAQYHFWTCSQLRPGQKNTCTASTAGEFNQFWSHACANAGGKLRPLLQQVRDRPGCFYATGLPPPSDRLATVGRNQLAGDAGHLPWAVGGGDDKHGGVDAMSDELILDVRNLRRSFGKVHAVQDVSFKVRKGQVVGFIGANGAGKTTTLRLLATLDTPDAGSIQMLGCDASNYPDRVRARLGWMPDSYGAL